MTKRYKKSCSAETRRLWLESYSVQSFRVIGYLRHVAPLETDTSLECFDVCFIFWGQVFVFSDFDKRNDLSKAVKGQNSLSVPFYRFVCSCFRCVYFGETS